jgi:RNA polymerase sigma factor (sigma-70 family)
MSDDLATAYEQYGLDLLRYARSRGFSLEEAEDVVSEVFVSALRSSYHEQGDIRGWLFCILRSRMIDQRRRWERRPSVPLIDRTDVPDEGMEDRILGVIVAREWLRRHLKKKKHGIAVWCYYIEGYTFDEVAQWLNVSQGAARAIIQRARPRLSQSQYWMSGRG